VSCTAAAGSSVPGNDPLRSGWYPDQPGLAPVSSGGCAFGQLFAAPVNGQVYAQPVVDVGTNTLLVATEANWIYGLDPATGAQKWARNLGVSWNASDLGCQDLTPTVGVTSTPAIDSATHTAYFFSKTYASGTSGPAAWYAHAVDIANGTERAGFPLLIQGAAANDPLTSFEAAHHLQRPGLLLMGGVVYAGFGSLCDIPDYRGWVVGVSTAGAIKTIWTDEALQPGSPGGGIWQSGGRLVSDRPGQILLVSGNGKHATLPTPGATPPLTLGQSVIRLAVQPSGALLAVDFFTPYNADEQDFRDLGVGAPLGLPSAFFGTPSIPNLAVVTSKSGDVYLLDRDHLGGYKQGPGGTDAVINTYPDTGWTFASPAVWPGDGGYVYIPNIKLFGSPDDYFTAYRYGLDANGRPALTVAGQSSDVFGLGASSAIITSDGTKSGSALVWVTDRAGTSAQLRAYDPVAVNGVLNPRGKWPLGDGTKFNTPTVSAGRIYVGTHDGHVLAFGAQTSASSQSESPANPETPAPAPTTTGPATTATSTAPSTLTTTTSSTISVPIGPRP